MFLLFLSIFVGLLFLLLFCPLRMSARFENQFSLSFRFLFFKFILFPAKKKKARFQHSINPQKSEKIISKPKKIGDFFDGDALSTLKKIFPLVTNSSRMFLRRLSIDKLIFKLCVAGSDAAATATNYANLCAVVYPFAGLVVASKCPKCYDIAVSPDFSIPASKVYMDIRLRIRPIILILLTIALLFKLVAVIYENRKQNS